MAPEGGREAFPAAGVTWRTHLAFPKVRFRPKGRRSQATPPHSGSFHAFAEAMLQRALLLPLCQRARHWPMVVCDSAAAVPRACL